MSLSHDGPAEDIPLTISYLSHTASNIEGRLLHLIKECTQGAVPLQDFVSELSLLSKDLQRCYRQAVEMKERRDLNFTAIAKLQEVDQHCVWLYRKINLEQAFFRKLHLETRHRSLISAEAFDVYQELINVEEHEREFRAKGDAEIKKLLLIESADPQPSDIM